MSGTTARPFLKWAGGKAQLLAQFEPFFPPELKAGKIRGYFEPFVGSGAVFFHVAQRHPLGRAHLFDINPELILVYKVVQRDVEALVEALRALAAAFLPLDEAGRKAFFYDLRARFNAERVQIDFTSPYQAHSWVPRAAQLLFLNKTCFNGLFRVNRKGEFNVPFGRYKNPRILDEPNLRAAAGLLRGVEIGCSDFDALRDSVSAGDFVYFDPPYRPLSPTASFTSYSTFAFDDEQQTRLAELFAALDRQGARLMLSNSDPTLGDENPADDFFERLYAGFNIRRVAARRAINSNPNRRGPISELIITNYRTD